LNKEDIYYFNLLKNKVTTVFLKDNNVSNSIDTWKGEEITAFQEDLFIKVKGRVSEKWFYTYFKNTPEKLPRIDMLNLLSNYVGSTNWNTFKSIHIYKDKKIIKNKNLLVFIAVFITSVFLIYKKNKTYQFYFCFVDAIKNESITKTVLDIKVLQENETPLYFKSDSLGCFSYVSKKEVVKFVIQSPYHKTDTIIRSISSNKNTTVKINSDDYALLLDYYANGNVKNREKHKDQLFKMIADDAQIYQLFGDNIGIEVYSKEDFIQLTTMPTTVVKQLKILDKKIENGKIVKLKFVVK